MNKHNIKVLFLLVRSRNNKKGSSSLKCRITYKLERKEFSTGKFINPKNWNSKQQLVEPPEPDVGHIHSTPFSNGFFSFFELLYNKW